MTEIIPWAWYHTIRTFFFSFFLTCFWHTTLGGALICRVRGLVNVGGEKEKVSVGSPFHVEMRLISEDRQVVTILFKCLFWPRELRRKQCKYVTVMCCFYEWLLSCQCCDCHKRTEGILPSLLWFCPTVRFHFFHLFSANFFFREKHKNGTRSKTVLHWK